MARLAIDKDFLDDYSKLEKTVQDSVKAAIDKFAEHIHAGLHLEKINHCKDDRIRTIRIDQFWRGVVLAPETGDTYSLLRVMPHDKAIEYAGSRRFTVNQALGVVEVRDQAALEQIQPALEQAATTRTPAVRARLRHGHGPARHRREHADDRPAAHLGRAPGRDAAHDSRGAVQRAVPARRRPVAWRRSGQEVAQYAPRAASRSIPATSSRRWSARPAAWSSSRSTTISTRSLSTRSRRGGSSCTRRSGRSLTHLDMRVRPR